MGLSERIRPNVEAAPWVIDAVKELEQQVEWFRLNHPDNALKYDFLTNKVKNLTSLLDDQLGTPCEQIRHKDEVEALQGENDRLKTALHAIVKNYDPKIGCPCSVNNAIANKAIRLPRRKEE
jgi:hypothetical protein